MVQIEQRGNKLMEVAAVEKAVYLEPTPRQGHMLQMFYNVNLGKSHRGLTIVAGEYGMDLTALQPGQYVGFFNRKRNACKLFAAGNCYAYIRLPDPNDQMTPDIVAQIPRAFQSQAPIGFTKALMEALESPITPSATELEAIEHGNFKRRLPGGKR